MTIESTIVHYDNTLEQRLKRLNSEAHHAIKKAEQNIGNVTSLEAIATSEAENSMIDAQIEERRKRLGL